MRITAGKLWLSDNDVRVRFRFSSRQRRMVPPATAVAATRSASDSNFVATKENGFACSGRSGNEICVRFYSSLPQRRIPRLQRSRGVQAGTGCHEGGIILSKKPPEWRLSLPQQRSASGSNFNCGRGEWFRLQRALLQRVPRPIQISSLQRR